MSKAVYAFYRGDKFIDVGTLKEISKATGLSINTLKWYQSEAARDRNKLAVVFKLEEDENAE